MKTFVLTTQHVLSIDLDADAAYLAFRTIDPAQEVYTTCPTNYLNMDFTQENDALVGMELLNLTRKFDSTLVDDLESQKSIQEANIILKKVVIV